MLSYLKIEIILIHKIILMLTTIQLWIYTIFKFIMEKLGRYRIINDRIDSKLYLERYYIFLRNRTWFPFNIFIHKFLQSDPDDLHDHPWGFISIPIYPGYWEWTKEGRYWRGPFSVRWQNSKFMHRVELHNKYNYCWTIFIPGYSNREWGFQTPTGWIKHDTYLNLRKQKKRT